MLHRDCAILQQQTHSRCKLFKKNTLNKATLSWHWLIIKFYLASLRLQFFKSLMTQTHTGRHPTDETAKLWQWFKVLQGNTHKPHTVVFIFLPLLSILLRSHPRFKISSLRIAHITCEETITAPLSSFTGPPIRCWFIVGVATPISEEGTALTLHAFSAHRRSATAAQQAASEWGAWRGLMKRAQLLPEQPDSRYSEWWEHK